MKPDNTKMNKIKSITILILELIVFLSIGYYVYNNWNVINLLLYVLFIVMWDKYKTKQEVKNWCKDNQPYYKKSIPEVAKYFIQKAKL